MNAMQKKLSQKFQKIPSMGSVHAKKNTHKKCVCFFLSQK